MLNADDHVQDFALCEACPKLCTFACPALQAAQRETTSPWAKMTLAGAWRRHRLPTSAETVAPLHYCLSCRLCSEYCKHEVDVGESLAATRASMRDDGLMDPALEPLRASFAAHQAPFALDLAARFRAVLGDERFVPEASAVYFPGCRAIAETPDEITRTFALFDALNLDYVAAYAGSVLCCGAPLYYAGERDAFAQHAHRLAATLLRYKRIVVPCPECAFMLKVRYADLGIPLTSRVQTLHEFLEPVLAAHTPVSLAQDRYVVQVEAHLARHLGLGARVPSLIAKAAGRAPEPLVWHDRTAYASGTSGLLPWVAPDVCLAVAQENVRQAQEVNAATLITTSPAQLALLSRLPEASRHVALLSDVALFLKAYAPSASRPK